MDPIFDTAPGMPRLLEVMRRLRDPDTGCPWDIVQTFATIAPYTIEEAYEVADAIEREAWDELEAELAERFMAGQLPLEPSVSLWEKLQQQSRVVEALNLDKKQAVLEWFGELADATR